jgi:lipoprotein-anchoring transpeptidase ErfK/SrfK
VTCAALAILAGCQTRPPPGAEESATPRVVRIRATNVEADDSEAAASTVDQQLLGTVLDNLPFAPTGEKLASTAWRTWVYTDTGSQRTRYGYLRAGAIVERRGPPIVNEGCAGGWWRINPRGFVCVGKGATLDLEHSVVRALGDRAVRGQGMPYLYALARDTAPHLYFRLPSRRQMEETESRAYLSRAAEFRGQVEQQELWELLRYAAQPPEFLLGGRALEKPYGVEKPLRYVAHAGQASTESGFALLRSFDWEGRIFGLTTELDLIAMDRTRLVRPTEFHGVELGPEEDLPVAIVNRPWISRYVRLEDGQFRTVGSVPKRAVINLTGQNLRRDGRYWETAEGDWVADAGVTLIEKRTSFPSVATGTRKWIDVSIKDQTLVAYVGEKAEYATLVSTGAGRLGDPEEVPATVRGTFMIHAKHISSTMDGEDDVSDSFELRDVPHVQYFHKGYALHGTYWHDDFGRPRSHGCVNLSPVDSAWLFEWTDPVVPEGWHAVLNKERGTVVYIHP